MLQRIQTVFMVAGIIWTLSVGFLGIFMVVDGVEIRIEDSIFYLIGVIVVALLFAISVALYRNRNLQVRINRLNTLVNLVAFGILAYVAYYHLPQIAGKQAHLLWASAIPVMNLVFLIMANRGIMADENMVRSLDRLR